MQKKLFIPGPVDVLPEVLKQMERPMISHRGKEISAILERIIGNTRKLMYTKNTILISTSSATGLMEGAIRNCVSKRCVNFANGAFAERWHGIAKECGKEADLVSVEWGKPITADIVDEALSSGKYDAMTMVHNETSTGVMSPISEIANVVKDYDVSFLVDTVSSMAGVKIEVDKLGIDVCLYGTQKCMALPPGLALCSVSDGALKKAEGITGRGHYFDFLALKKSIDKLQTTTTPAISLLYALDYQLDRIINKEGQENRYKRHAEMAGIARKWAADNFELIPEEKYASNTVTAIRNTKSMDLGGLKKKLAEKGYEFSNGYGKFKDVSFRIPHMGDRTVEELMQYLDDLNECISGPSC